jgi:hypothetical protein
MTREAETIIPFGMGRASAAMAASWRTCPYNMGEICRREWLKGWFNHIVKVIQAGEGVAMFHVEQSREGAYWTAEELEIIDIGRHSKTPIPYEILAKVLGRSEMSVKVQWSRSAPVGMHA